MPPHQSRQGPMRPPTAMHQAARCGAAEAIMQMVQGGMDVDARDNKGCTPLVLAAAAGHCEAAEALIQSGAGIHMKDSAGHTPLHAAAKSGRMGTVHLMLEAGASIDSCTDQGLTALYVAADDGYAEIVRMLIRHGANPAVQTPTGETPMYAASFSGHVDVVRELLQSDVDPSITTHRGCGPFGAAAQEGHKAIVWEFLIRGPDACGGIVGTSAALNLAAKEQNVEILEMLLQTGVQDYGGNAILNAALFGRVRSVKLLLDASGGETNHRNRVSGASPLHQAAEIGHVKITCMLLQAGASETALDNEGLTPVVRATQPLRWRLTQEKPPIRSDREKQATYRTLLRGPAFRASSWRWNKTEGVSTLPSTASEQHTPKGRHVKFVRPNDGVGRSTVVLKRALSYANKP